MKKALFTLISVLCLQFYFSQVSFVGNPDYGRMKNFVYDKTTPNKIYATTYIGKHIVVSTDNGASWNVLYTLPYPEYDPDIREMRLTNNGTALSFIEHFGTGASYNKVAVLDLQTNTISKEYQFPQNEDVDVILNYSIFDNGTMNTISMLTDGIQNKFFTSIDGGATWTKVYDGADHESVLINDAIMNPANPDILYIARNGGAGNEDGGFFTSTDGGATWTETLSGLILQTIAVDPNNPNTIYTGSGLLWSYPEQHQAVYKSTDGGATWTEQTQITWSTSGGLGEKKIVNRIEINPNDSNHVVVMGEDRVAVTTDNGANWTTTVHTGLSDGQSYYDGTNAAFNPSNSNEVLIANRRYPKFSNNKGVTLTSLKNPFFTGMGNANIINDNGTDKLMYGVQYGYTVKNLETNEETPINVLPLGVIMSQIGAAFADENHAGRVYTFETSFMGNNILVSDDYGVNSTPIYNTYDQGFTAAETDPSNPNTAWLATFNGVNASLVKVNFSNPDDIQTDWIMLPYDQDYIYGIKVNQNNPNEVLITVGNKLLKTTNGGTDWTEISAGLDDLTLPNIALQLTRNPKNLNQYIIAASNGIYTSADSGNTWTKIYNGMVHKVEHSTKKDGQIIAFSYSYLDSLPKIIYTNDGGNSWTEKVASEYFNTIIVAGAARFLDEDNAEVYLTSQSLGILKDHISLETLTVSDSDINKSNISVYPNPTQNFINIKLDKDISKFKAVLYNAAGQILLTTENKSTIDISNLNNGVYFLKIESENGRPITKKIIKN